MLKIWNRPCLHPYVWTAGAIPVYAFRHTIQAQ